MKPGKNLSLFLFTLTYWVGGYLLISFLLKFDPSPFSGHFAGSFSFPGDLPGSFLSEFDSFEKWVPNLMMGRGVMLPFTLATLLWGYFWTKSLLGIGRLGQN